MEGKKRGSWETLTWGGRGKASKERTGMTVEFRTGGWEFRKPVVGGLRSGFKQRNLIWEHLGQDREERS